MYTSSNAGSSTIYAPLNSLTRFTAGPRIYGGAGEEICEKLGLYGDPRIKNEGDLRDGDPGIKGDIESVTVLIKIRSDLS